MTLVTTAIVPILLLLAAGALLRQRVLTDPGFWRGLEWMSYRVFTPALFVLSIADTDLTVVPLGPLLLSLAAPILAVTCILIALRRPLRATGPQLTSVVQGAIRINTYIGLIFASTLHGQGGVAVFALASTIVVPLVNVISVSMLTAYGDKARNPKRKSAWREFLENPLIQGCAVGLALNFADLPLPEFLKATAEMLAAPALACGTLIAGAALHFTFRKRDTIDVGLATVLKLVILPLSTVAIAIPLGVTGASLASTVLICAVPTAPSAYVLASRMGGDTRLMASITAIQTILAMVTLPGVLMLTEHLARQG
ncbi:AEC family transporter [Paenarthrobacter sp. AB444]|uniref:AEC family transporter n=1 Tax=Paenarthrobacter sp. AB444 TaxID=3025681 RepID=UPI00236636D6|nr:AEC family transporter [Paenarthrobacter sp. AB444]MDD7833840.1 AEC family transporter [Paenarthrobacter sp. AB444]